MAVVKFRELESLSKRDEERYWGNVDRTGNARGCWLWTGSCNSKGYGRFFVDGKHYQAHRLAWILAGRAIQANLFICHTCDNGRCVNPDHLIMGDAVTNNRDAMLKRNLNGKHAGVRKPHKEFPLFPHSTRRWAKKVHGKFHYFGSTVNDPTGAAALEKWLDQKDDLLAGRKPRVKSDGLQIYDLCNRFLTPKEELRDAGRLSPRTFADYKKTCERIIAAFGSTRLVSDLAADDFEGLRARLMKQFGPIREGNEIQRVRSVFKYAYEAGLIDSPVRFGPSFKRPSQAVLRRNRNAKGPKMFQAADLRTVCEKASLPMRAMVLLALNTGFGNTDLSTLPIDALDLAGGWVNFPRPKTGIMRRAKLWPETIKAVKEWDAERPTPKDEADARLVFVTKFGQPFVKLNEKGHPADALGQEFSKVIKELGLHRPGLGFYSLRHVFETVAGGCRDQVAVNHVMGHVDPSMAAHYREHIGDDRLVAVADHVRRWLFPPEKKAKAKAK